MFFILRIIKIKSNCLFRSFYGLSRYRYIPTKIIKQNIDIFTDFVHQSINASINDGDFLLFLKLANVILVFIKYCKNSQDNFKEISIRKLKAFDCLSYELLIAKLPSYSFSLNALRLIHRYLSNRSQRIRINESYNLWEKFCLEYLKDLF